MNDGSATNGCCSWPYTSSCRAVTGRADPLVVTGRASGVGTINGSEMIKRQTFSRAGLDLLRKHSYSHTG